MTIDAETARALERLHVRAWPATEAERVDGWLWRWSGGASQRANSVSTVDFTGTDPEASLARVEALYLAKAAPVRFHTFDLSGPPGLPALLAARGFRAGETTLTLMAPAKATTLPADVEVSSDPGRDWLDVYMGAITPDRRAVNRTILDRVPAPRAFFSVRREGRVISTALCVVDGDHAVAECVATRADSRGQRGAEAAMRALIGWAAGRGARIIALQVVDGNVPALALYRRLGFSQIGENRFWVR